MDATPRHLPAAGRRQDGPLLAANPCKIQEPRGDDLPLERRGTGGPELTKSDPLPVLGPPPSLAMRLALLDDGHREPSLVFLVRRLFVGVCEIVESRRALFSDEVVAIGEPVPRDGRGKRRQDASG